MSMNHTFYNYFFRYIIAINVFSFLQMGLDKSLARNGRRRIRERSLFIAAALGGSVGSILGMYCFRHKTLHSTFKYGMPAILLVQILIGGITYVFC